MHVVLRFIRRWALACLEAVRNIVLSYVWMLWSPKALAFDPNWWWPDDHPRWIPGIHKGRARRFGSTVYVTFEYAQHGDGSLQSGALAFDISDRGTRWCLGWEGQEADAFRVACALTDRAS